MATEATIRPVSEEPAARPSVLPPESKAGAEPVSFATSGEVVVDVADAVVVSAAGVEVPDVLDVLEVMVVVEVTEAVEELVVLFVTVLLVETVKVVLDRVAVELESVTVDVDVGAEQKPHVRSHLPAASQLGQNRAAHNTGSQGSTPASTE